MLSGLGGLSESDCLACPPGYYCDGSGLAAPTGPCPAGKFCNERTERIDDAMECTAGHMCPEGSPVPLPCPQGTKQPLKGKATCVACSVGEICNGGTVDGTICPAGFKCPEGTAVPTSFPCPPGTFSDNPGLMSSACVPCPKGFYCESAGSVKPTGPCKGGYFCLEGTAWREPTTFCKHGEICPPGSATPKDCPPNHFCNTIKLAEPSGPCSGGFVCTARSTTPRPTGAENGEACEENMMGRPCLSGHYCPPAESPLIAGTGFAGSGGDGLPGPQGFLMLPASAVMDPDTKDIYVADFKNFAVKVVRGETGIIDTVVSANSVTGNLNWIRNFGPIGLAFCTAAKKLYISYPGRNAILEYDVAIRSSSIMDTLSANVLRPLGLSLDTDCKSLYVADSGNHRVLQHSLGTTSVTSIIGTGTAGENGVTEKPLLVQLNLPSGITLNGDLLYVADSGNSRVLEVNIKTSQISVLAGDGNIRSSGGSKRAAEAPFKMPVSVAVADYKGATVLVVSDAGSRILKQVDLQTKEISMLVDYSAWKSAVVNEAEQNIATIGLAEAFYGISTFFGKSLNRTGIILADSYMHRIRRIDLHEDLYARPPVSDIPCPAGTYLPYKGAASVTDCIPCPAGMYCRNTGLTEPQGPCRAGYYCPRGSKSPTEHKCTPGHFCSPHTDSIMVTVRRLSSSRLSKLPEVTTDLESASHARTLTSGWFRGALCSPYNSSLSQSSGDDVEEDVLVIELETPTDLRKVYVEIEGHQTTARLSGVEVKRENTFSTISWKQQASNWPISIPKRRRFLQSKGRQIIKVGNSAEDLTRVELLRLWFPREISASVDRVVLTTRETRGPVAERQCHPGTFQENEGATSCKTCPAGYYCDEFRLQAPKKCPKGYLCPEGSVRAAAHYCTLGWISKEAGASTTEACVPCEKGKFCAVRGAMEPTGPCSAGYYCTEGSWTTTPIAGMTHPETGKVYNVGDICPPMAYCPEGATKPIPCPAGTVSESKGVTSQEGCYKCSAGFACVSEGVRIPCAAGYICLEGSNTTTPTDGRMGTRCPAGSFCPEGSFSAKICPAGTFSHDGQSSCTPCSLGTYCPFPGSTSDGQPCPVGHYCDKQTVIPQPCGPGKLQDELGKAVCKPCPRGYYCSDYRASAPTEKCSEGSVCVESATHPRTTDQLYSFEAEKNGLCPPGYFCKQGTLKPEPCAAGKYQDKPGASACLDCPAGKYCSGTGNKTPTGDCAPGFLCYSGATTSRPTDGTTGSLCPKGWFCEEGATHPMSCPPGRYTSQAGQDTCQLCPKGFYCDKAGEEPKACPEERICPEGSAQPALCPLGSIPSSDKAGSDTCIPCPYGRYCRGGVIAGDCLAGFLCGLGNWVPNPSRERVYNEPYVPPSASAASGVALLTLQNWKDLGETGYGGIPCPPGHYCPAGATAPQPCPSGSVRRDTLGRWQNDCTICPKGFFCPHLSLIPEPCPAGHFCPLGSSEPRPCLGGTYNPHQEGSGTASCLLCPPGYICFGEGTSELRLENQCPLGHYCLEGSQHPIPCPPGSYADERRLASESGCKPCPAGTYCPSEGSREPGADCPVGHVCPSGTAVPRRCLQGTWCPAGSGTAQVCPSGSLCPAGSGAPQPCPSGSYCPFDLSIPIPCPAGYMGSVDRSDSTTLASGCTICPKGTYTDQPGMTECLPCTPGYACLEGCNTALPTSKERDNGFRCSPGTYCPLGSSEEILCPAGTYGLQAASSSVDSCFPCPSGTYNALEGQTGCVLCGATATSDSRATSCTCKGSNRSFQTADRSCVCLSGFHYIQGKQDLSSQDGTAPCQQTVYDECVGGKSRDTTGVCTLPTVECTKQCGPIGGSFSTISGLCSCFGEKNLDDVCDETCRAALPQLILKDSTLVINSPYSTVEDKEFGLEELTTNLGLVSGDYKCQEQAGCSIWMLDTTLAKMIGLVGVPQSFIDDLSERLHQENFSGVRSSKSLEGIHPRILSDVENFGYFGVSDPVLCIPLGSTVAWHLRPSPNPIYPIYLRTNLLNTNQKFDYGAFRELDNDMQGGEQRILFLFTFKEPGLYVFGLNTNPSKMLILRVMDSNRLCRTNTLLPQLRTPQTLAAVSVLLPTALETSSWLLFVTAVVAIIVATALLFAAAWTLTRQNLQCLKADFTETRNSLDGHLSLNGSSAASDVADLVLQTQPEISLKEDPAVVRARRAFAKQLAAQDPRLFVAVLNLANEIQRNIEELCDLVTKERTKGLSDLLELTRNSKQELVRHLLDAVTSEVWEQENDKEREMLLNSLLSLLRLTRKGLINKLARVANQQEEEFRSHGKKERFQLLQHASGLWSQCDFSFSSILLPAVSENEQSQISSMKLSVEAQMESLLEEFSRARADAEGNLADIMELYKAKLRSLLEEVKGENGVALKRMLSVDIEEHLMKGSTLLELNKARASLEASEDEADERRTVGAYLITSSVAQHLRVYTATLLNEISCCTQAADEALSEARDALSLDETDSEKAANVLRATVASSLKQGSSRVNAAALKVEQALSTAKLEAVTQAGSWVEHYQGVLRDSHDAVIMAQNDAINLASAAELRLLAASMQAAKSQILDQIRSRYSKLHDLRWSICLEEMQLFLNASVSELGRRKQQQLIDDALNKASTEVEHLCNAELGAATAALDRIITQRTESLKKRQAAFKSRRLILLQQRQEAAVQHVQLQANATSALVCRGLDILLEQFQAVKNIEAILFQNLAGYGGGLAELMTASSQDICEADALREELKSQQIAVLTKHEEQLLASLQNQRKAITEELLDLEARSRKALREELEDVTEKLRQATMKLDEEIVSEDSVRDEYDTILFNLRQQHLKGLRELEVTQSLAAFKQRLLSRVNNMLLSRAAEAKNNGIADLETDERSLQQWKNAADELEPILVREQERYCHHVDMAYNTQKVADLQVLGEMRERRRNQAALIKVMESSEEQNDDELRRKRLAFSTNEVRRVVWRLCTCASVAGAYDRLRNETPKLSVETSEDKNDEAVHELQKELRRRRRLHLECCRTQGHCAKGKSIGALAMLQEQAVQGISNSADVFQSFSRGIATLDAAESSESVLALIDNAQHKLEKALAQIQKDQEEEEEREKRELEEERVSRQKAHEEAKQKLSEEHEAKLALADADSQEQVLQEHQLALSQLESALEAEQQEQEERAQRRLLERQQRIKQRRQEAEDQKQKEIQSAKAELETRLVAEAKKREEEAEQQELQRLADEGTNTAAVIELFARRHDRELSSLLRELSLKKAENISALTEQFWKSKGGSSCEGHSKELKELYKAELQEYLLVQELELDSQSTLLLQELQKRQSGEVEDMLKYMERSGKMKQETEMQQLSDVEQYTQLKKEAEADVAEEVGVLEERMMEQQQHVIQEMEGKRQMYDKLMRQMKQRKEAEEKRRALRLIQEQRLKQEGQQQGSGLKNLMGQLDADRLLLEEAVVMEAERQHACMRKRMLLRNAERSERLHQKRLLEKQRFLVNQNEIRRREVALSSARAEARSKQNLIEALNRTELKKRMELANRLEEERHWAPIWRQIIEEEQTAGTFDSWGLDNDQIPLGGQFSTHLLHTERMLHNKSSYLRELIGGFQKLIDVISFIKFIPDSEDTTAQNDVTLDNKTSGSASSSSLDSEESSENDAEGTDEHTASSSSAADSNSLASHISTPSSLQTSHSSSGVSSTSSESSLTGENGSDNGVGGSGSSDSTSSSSEEERD